MKKIIAIVLAVSSLFFLTVSKSLAEWTVGLSVTSGLYEAEGSETQEGDNEVSTAAEEAQFTYPSIFFEYKWVLERFTLPPWTVNHTLVERFQYGYTAPLFMLESVGYYQTLTNYMGDLK